MALVVDVTAFRVPPLPWTQAEHAARDAAYNSLTDAEKALPWADVARVVQDRLLMLYGAAWRRSVGGVKLKLEETYRNNLARAEEERAQLQADQAAEIATAAANAYEAARVAGEQELALKVLQMEALRLEKTASEERYNVLQMRAAEEKKKWEAEKYAMEMELVRDSCLVS
jgi:hypothetical protein